MPLQLEDYLPTLDDTPMGPGGKPLQLAIDLIDEDPLQPRSEFDVEALGELAKTIAMRGVLQPVSVRPHPEREGRWLLNFGARRLRASKMAGKKEIAAFVDEPVDSYCKVIENEHREGLKPLELALFVKGELESGRTRAEIARGLGKSGAYVTYVCALIDAPDWLLEVYRSGRCRGVLELYDLRRAYEVHPQEVSRLIDTEAPIGRADIRRILDRPPLPAGEEGSALLPRPEGADHANINVKSPDSPSSSRSVATNHSGLAARERASGHLSLVAATPAGVAEVLLDPVPPSRHEVFVVDPVGKGRRSISLAELCDLRLVRS